MPQKAPGRYYRDGLSLMDIFRKFPDDAAAEKWIIETRWPSGICCVKCGSVNVQTKTTHPKMPFRCRDCRGFFSPKSGTPMANSKLGYQAWAIAIYLMTVGIKGVASMRLHRDLSITQKSAWHMAMRIRESWDRKQPPFGGPVEADESYFGGKAKNMHAKIRKAKIKGRGPVGKTAVAGVKDRETGRMRAVVVDRTDEATLSGFVSETAADGAKVYTDESSSYQNLPNHETVQHGVGQYVDGQAHINGMESFWSLMKRGYHGTYHRMSPKHLPRYVNEFAGRHNDRPKDTTAQMAAMVQAMEGKRLRYRDLVKGTGRQSMAE